jgi:hypothetical protein
MQTAEIRELCETHNIHMSDDISPVSECVSLSTINYYYSTCLSLKCISHFACFLLFWRVRKEIWAYSLCQVSVLLSAEKLIEWGVLINISTCSIQIKIVQKYCTFQVETYMRIGTHLQR